MISRRRCEGLEIGPIGSGERAAVDSLGLDLETMRELGYQTVDWLVERLAVSGGEPTMTRASPVEMDRRVSGPPPRQGEPLEVILRRLGEDVLPYRSRCDNPRYLAFVPGSGTWPGALGDLIASAYNIDVGSWMESAGPSQLELVLLRWFAETIGYPSTASGVLVSGGSAANMTALACARETMVGAMSTDVVAYVSDQAHSSVARAARMLGFRSDQVRVLPVDVNYRMRVDALRDAMDADVAAGRRPLMVIAAAGSTNTGAVDPFSEIADICRPRGVWLHVDGAYGGFAALTDRGRKRLEGLSLADSVTLDPHKWLYQPFECGALLVREGHRLRDAFAIHPDYLQDVAAAQQETNFADQGLQLTRMSRALKLWVSLSYFGTDAFVAAIDRAMDLAERAQRHIEHSPAFELLVPATLGIVCFRRRLPGAHDEGLAEAINSALVADLAESGEGLISSTRLRGSYAMRMCVLNHTTTWSDVERVLRWLEQAEVAATETTAPPNVRAAELDGGWLRPPAESLNELQQIPLFAGLDHAQLMRLRSNGRTRRVEAAESVVRQWDVDRDFYVILNGTAEVFAADRQLTELSDGDFFGELAALDWGASFGYPRLATVRASTPLRMLVLTDVQLAELMRSAPSVAAKIRSAAAERLARG